MLITRPEPGATQTAERVAALGYDPVVAPLLTVIPTASALRPPANISATVLTSRNAVPACPEWCHGLPAFTVGSATAARARAAGFGNVIDADADAAALPALIESTLPPGRHTLFLPTGRRQGHDLAAALRQRGHRVIRRVAYDAASVAALPHQAEVHLKHQDLAAAMFFSTETARAFVRLVRQADLVHTVADIAAVSISERTAVALRSLTWRRIVVADKPNQEAMLVLLT